MPRDVFAMLGAWACVREAVAFAMKSAYHTLLYLSTLSEIRAFRNVIIRLHCAPAAVPLPKTTFHPRVVEMRILTALLLDNCLELPSAHTGDLKRKV